MKKRTKSLSTKLPPVRIYADDVKRIVSILSEISSDYVIITEEHEFDDVDTFLKNTEQEVIHSLCIRTNYPYFQVDLGRGRSWMSAHEDTLQMRGVFETIKEILLSRRAIYKNPYVQIPFDGLIGATCSIYLYFDSWNMSLKIGLAVLHLILAIFLINKISKHSVSTYNSIYLISKTKAPSFWKRKRDDIILGVFSATIGAVITLIITKLFSN